MTAPGFTASLHPLSLADAVRASALRTPGRIAVVDGGAALTYAGIAAGGASRIARWLSQFQGHRDGEDPGERALILRALDNVVQHAAFDRDEATASSLPLDTEAGATAAALALLLGCTLHLVDARELAAGVAAGTFRTCWLAAAQVPEGAPAPAAGFRLALCEGAPPASLVRWLGQDRVAQAA